MIDLKGHLAIVTGGSKGIGRSIAEALLKEGAVVAICGRDQSALASSIQEMSGSGRIVGRPCDVGRWDDAESFYSFVDRELGGVDILVNNAGVGRFGPVDQLTADDWDEVIQTNLSGPFYFSHLAVPRMKRRGGGFILNIGSLAGKHPFASGAAYNASKFGLAGFTEAMMLDLRYSNIRVSIIMPGSVQTGFRGRSTVDAEWKLDPAAIASMAIHLLKTPARNLASRVEMRPSKPRQK
jgi:NAD(P)-dependent dehydrogenase (short-subunit alcohol dehydrogenase family)